MCYPVLLHVYKYASVSLCVLIPGGVLGGERCCEGQRCSVMVSIQEWLSVRRVVYTVVPATHPHDFSFVLTVENKHWLTDSCEKTGYIKRGRHSLLQEPKDEGLDFIRAETAALDCEMNKMVSGTWETIFTWRRTFWKGSTEYSWSKNIQHFYVVFFFFFKYIQSF